VKARIPILSFFLLALILSCKSITQSGDQGSSLVVVPETETLLSQNQELGEIPDVVNTSGIDEEIPHGSGIDAEDNFAEALEEESEETLAEIEQPESTKIEEAEVIPEESEIEKMPEIAGAPIQEEEQEGPIEVKEERASLPSPEPAPIEPQIVQQPAPAEPPPPPPVQLPVQSQVPVQPAVPPTTLQVQPPVQSQVPVQPAVPPTTPQVQPPVQSQVPVQPAVPPTTPQVQPPVQSQVPVQPAVPPTTPQVQPPVQSQVPERTTTRDPPPPPPFLVPAEPERPPPVRQEVPPPVLPELPSLPRNETPETPIVFSRVVRMTVGQILEVPFRGTGWVYQGELGNRRGISYDSTRTDTERTVSLGQSIIFRAEAVGTYILRFYRRDYIQDYIINDYVQVIVGEADDSGRGRTGAVIDRGRVVAEPRWPSIPETAGSTSETVSPPTGATAAGASTTGAPVGTTADSQRSDAVQAAELTGPTVSGSAPATSAPSQAAASPPAEVVPPEEYVRQAKQEFDAGHVEQALVIIEQMRQRYPSGTDEAWWLLGQLYEANSPARDIRQSLECYRTLVNEYPQSNRIDDARRRIAYLERYYLNIR